MRSNIQAVCLNCEQGNYTVHAIQNRQGYNRPETLAQQAAEVDHSTTEVSLTFMDE